MNYHIDIQNVCEEIIPISNDQLISWIQLTLSEHKQAAELTIRLVNSQEITELNHTYRQKNKATNVLAFPSMMPDTVKLEYPLLGDIIICPEVLQAESIELGTPLVAHWAHIVIHGVLHLLGYDHIKDEDAKIMQTLETQLLARLNFGNPYHTKEDNIE